MAGDAVITVRWCEAIVAAQLETRTITFCFLSHRELAMPAPRMGPTFLNLFSDHSWKQWRL